MLGSRYIIEENNCYNSYYFHHSQNTNYVSFNDNLCGESHWKIPQTQCDQFNLAAPNKRNGFPQDDPRRSRQRRGQVQDAFDHLADFVTLHRLVIWQGICSMIRSGGPHPAWKSQKCPFKTSVTKLILVQSMALACLLGFVKSFLGNSTGWWAIIQLQCSQGHI